MVIKVKFSDGGILELSLKRLETLLVQRGDGYLRARDQLLAQVAHHGLR